MTNVPSDAELRTDYEAPRNWGRWGDDDQIGALNLVSPAKRLAALALARTGRAVSLSRPYSKAPGPRNPNPAQHFMNIYIGLRAGGPSPCPDS